MNSTQKQNDEENAVPLPKEDYTNLPKKIMRNMAKHNISKALDKTIEQNKDLELPK